MVSKLNNSDVKNIDLYGDKGDIDENFQLHLFENKSVNLIIQNKKKEQIDSMPLRNLFKYKTILG